jgi:hypothetical protein
MLEGESDIFSKKKKQKSTCLPKPCDLTKGISKKTFNDKMQSSNSMREGDAS